MSYFLCLVSGAVHAQIVDSSFFKAVGLLLAVLLSLRAKNAVSRRQKLMVGVLDMMNTAKNLLYLLSDKDRNRRRMRAMLQFCFMEVAIWVTRNTPNAAFTDAGPSHSLADLDPEDREAVFVLRSKCAAGIGPRPLMLFLRDFCDELFDPDAPTESKFVQRPSGDESAGGSPPTKTRIDKVSIIRRFHRNLETELHALFEKFDFLLMYREQFMTMQFRWMLDTVIFVYVLLYPWCVRNETRTVLGATTAGMAFVFYGLNALTEQLEDPVQQKGQGFNLPDTFRVMFEDLDYDEVVRTRCNEFLRSSKEAGAAIDEELHKKFEEEIELEQMAPPSQRSVEAENMVVSRSIIPVASGAGLVNGP